MKKLITTTFVVMAALLLFGSCAKTVDPVWMVMEEDNCRPPWVGKTDHKTRDNLEAVLRADGVIPLKIRIKGKREFDGEPCGTPTGKTYHVQIDRSQISWLYWYGFENE
ncbi:MAG: hypothetical protein ABJG68_13510 [Crocinitomicaceae bacterium]